MAAGQESGFAADLGFESIAVANRLASCNLIDDVVIEGRKTYGSDIIKV